MDWIPASVAGAVLAGGASRRMGQDKAALVLGGETLLARVVRRLGAAVGEVFVVGPPERAALVPGTRVVPDARPGQGPLGGIYSALMATDAPFVFVVACDMPFLRPELIRYLASRALDCDIVVPRSARGTEQLHAVYGRACLPAAAECLHACELAVATLFGHVRTCFVEPAEWARYDPDGRAMFNANTAQDWQRVIAEVGSETADKGADK
jgi:molybdopterin-guanine dinucleotide biosynthesis protein A